MQITILAPKLLSELAFEFGTQIWYASLAREFGGKQSYTANSLGKQSYTANSLGKQSYTANSLLYCPKLDEAKGVFALFLESILKCQTLPPAN